MRRKLRSSKSNSPCFHRGREPKSQTPQLALLVRPLRRVCRIQELFFPASVAKTVFDRRTESSSRGAVGRMKLAATLRHLVRRIEKDRLPLSRYDLVRI